MISRSKYRSAAEVCADCGASDPSWASINRGLLLCTECCSVHRSMGRHISHVKSLRQGTWPPSLLAMIQTATVQNVNCVWEHSLLDTSAPKHLRKKPQPKDPLHPTKSEFIQSKHLRLAYVLRARREEGREERGGQLHAAVRSGSLDTALRLLAQGADPNFHHPDKGSACLHAAARAGQAAQCELLVAWGAAPDAEDSAGSTPAAVARAAGHAELWARLWQLQFQAVDALSAALTGSWPGRAPGRPWLPPVCSEQPPALHMTDGAKAARGKLQLLPNHLFEELVMDIYDEVDRRETEATWQSEAGSLRRLGVAFLPVNPALSAPRNQARQKLATLSGPELRALLRDALQDAARRQRVARLRPLLTAHSLQPEDDEPLYDSVASDDDYALPPHDHDMSTPAPLAGETVSPAYNPSLPDQSAPCVPAPPAVSGEGPPQLEALRLQLQARDCTISSLRDQLLSLQTLVDQLTRENSQLKSSSVDDEHSVSSQPEPADLSPDGGSGDQSGERAVRGHSLGAGGAAGAAGGAGGAGGAPRPAPARPQSMFERPDRERAPAAAGWQIDKQQSQEAAAAEPGPGLAAEVERRAEALSRAIGALWAAARHQRALPHTVDIEHAVSHLMQLFPTPWSDPAVSGLLEALQAASSALRRACQAASPSSGPLPLHSVRAAAYELAKATKALLTHYQRAPS